MSQSVQIAHLSSAAPLSTTQGAGSNRSSSHRAPAAAHTVRAPAASRHFPARFRGTFRAPPSSPESAAERPRGVLASPQHPVQHIVVSFRRPKHLYHMLRGGTRLGPEVLTSARRAATGAQSTNPATVPPPAKLFCSVRTINLESAAERARSFGVDTHFSGASGAARLSSAAPRAVLGPQVLWRGPRSGRGVFWRVQHLVQHPTPKALLSSAP